MKLQRRSQRSESSSARSQEKDEAALDASKTRAVSYSSSKSLTSTGQLLAQRLIGFVLNPLYHFLHDRTGPSGCRLSGWIRVSYALLYLYSRCLLAIQVPFLLDPKTGVIPYSVTRLQMDEKENWTLFQYAPESRGLLYGLFAMGLTNGILLLLGVAPRLQACGIFFFLHNLYNHNGILFDNQEHMLRLWSFMLIWLPLDHITIYDNFGGWVPRIQQAAQAQLNRINGKFLQKYTLSRAVVAKIQQAWYTVAGLFHQLQRGWKAYVGGPIQRGWNGLVNGFWQLVARVSSSRGPDLQTTTPLLYLNRVALLPKTSSRLEDEQVDVKQSRKERAQSQSQSWPMWPFRIWQVFTCMVYMGAALGKAVAPVWQDGTAIYWVWYEEGSLRYYPEFIKDLLFNRLFAIKLQTWLSLVIELACFVTIWPMATRKWTFVAIVILHIGIELSLLMHIFEYISVLGWVCFFVLPRDGKTMEKPSQTSSSEAISVISKTKGVDSTEKDLENPTKEGYKHKSASSLLRWARPLFPPVKILHTFVAVTLLYTFIIDTLPLSAINYFLPPPLPRSARRWLSPAKREVHSMAHWTGIETGSWTLFAGKPPHFHARLTAVIQFNNGTSTLWRLPEWEDQSILQREMEEWSGAFYYYLAKEYTGEVEAIPYYASFAMHLAQKFSEGGIAIDHENDEKPIKVAPHNKLMSISIVSHEKKGRDPPKRMRNWFVPMPRDWDYSDECQYVLRQKFLREEVSNLGDLLRYNEEEPFRRQSHCATYNEDEDDLHMMGSYIPKYERRSKDFDSGTIQNFRHRRSIED